MSVFRCNICENYIDADYDGCYEDLKDDCGCLCENCSMEQEEEMEAIKLKKERDLERLKGMSIEQWFQENFEDDELEEA